METKHRAEVEIDELALRQAQMGVLEAQEKLVRDNYSRVKSFLRRFERDQWELEDLCQEVFVNALRGLKTFRNDCSFQSWLISIARNTAIDRIRRDAKRSSHADEAMQVALRRWHEAGGWQFGDGNARDEQLAALGECLQSLPGTGRELIDAYYFQNQTAESISREYGRTSGSIRMALMRVRQALARCVKKRMRISGE